MDLNAQPILLPSSPSSEMPIQSIEDSFSDSAHSASARNSAGGDEAIFDSNPESHSTRQSSPHTSSGCESHFEDECTDNDDLISSLPTDSRTDSRASSCVPFTAHDPLPYTPPKTRSPFRNPSSVRGMQLELTPPHLRSPTTTSRRSQQSRQHRHRPSTHSRTSTPRSVRSHLATRHHLSPIKPTAPPPPPPQQQQQPPKKEHPLILLHVTLLPIASPYSAASLAAIAPPHILSNWTLLREKIPDTVLERGILIPHPREDYELLEERLLESLELATPRILKCGHFRLDADEEAAALAEAREAEFDAPQQHRAGAGSRCDGGDACEHSGAAAAAVGAVDEEGAQDPDLCVDCGRRVRDGRSGSAGKGGRRWDMRIYAANGLMRAGAWAAAWREMERVDVEICPFMEDGVRRELEGAKALEEREMALGEMEGGSMRVREEGEGDEGGGVAREA
ncbi:MAG: hypothetical protein LQ340_008012, partial [Diploschistes diacapsis]